MRPPRACVSVRRTIWAVLCTLGVLSVVVSASAAPKQISIVYCSDCVPFHFTDKDGKPAGMIIDLWHLWSKKTGTAIKFRAAAWDKTLIEVKNGAADVHAGLFFSPERNKYLEYGSFLAETETHVFANKSLPPITHLTDLAPYKVGVLAGDFVESFFRKKLPQGNVVAFKNYEAIMKALRNKELQVFAADTPTGIYHLQKAELGFEFGFSSKAPLYRNKWLVAAKKGNRRLVAAIDAGMSAITEQERKAIIEKWVSLGAGAKFPLKVLIYSFLAALVIIGIVAILLWNRSLQSQIRLRTLELEQELDEHLRTGQALQVAKTEADEANAAKTRFLTTVSHELRTPLTAIGGSLSLIAGGVAGKVPDDVKELVDIANDSAKRLGRLIDDILDLEKIRSSKMEYRFQTVELSEILETAVEANRAYAAQYGVVFDINDSLPRAMIRGDRDRLLQVMANILSNAAKFSERGGHVEIGAQRQTEYVQVSVTDHGMGISEEFRDKIFGEFARSELADIKQVKGTGLGLSISKSIIESHQGSIAFESNIDRGTRFFFDLPTLSDDECEGVRDDA
jgi:signal transduction histidine kinase